MSILARYLSWIFVGQLLMIMFCAMALLQLFDLMSNADDLLRDMKGQSNVLLRYTLLRLPDLITFITPFSVLLAALMAFGRLHRHSELVAMQAAGRSVTQIVLMLLPALFAVSFLHFLLSDQLTPRTNRALADWLDASKKSQPHDIELWLRDGDHLVSIGRIDDNGRRLENVVIFKRSETGSLEAQTKASTAYHDEDRWWLSEIRDLTARPGIPPREAIVARKAWQTRLQPGLVKDLAAPPNALSIAKLKRVLDHPEIGSRPMHVYETWLHKSFSQPLVSIFMVALAAASVRGLQRQGGVVTNALVGFGGAFLYFIADGVLQALGEAGSIRPVFAAWLPLVLLAVIAAGVLTWVAAPRGRRKPGTMPGAGRHPTSSLATKQA